MHGVASRGESLRDDSGAVLEDVPELGLDEQPMSDAAQPAQRRPVPHAVRHLRAVAEVFELAATGDPEWTPTRAVGVLRSVAEAMAYRRAS